MLRHVLVPLDGSPISEQAVHFAQEILASGGKITLLSVIESPINYGYTLVDVPLTLATPAYDEPATSEIHQRIQAYLGAQGRKLAEKGYEVEMLIESGDPATVIHDTASKLRAHAIVMTTHGRTGLSRWLFGSVTQKVISSMPCPVMVVPGIQHVESSETAEAVAVVKPAVATA